MRAKPTKPAIQKVFDTINNSDLKTKHARGVGLKMILKGDDGKGKQKVIFQFHTPEQAKLFCGFVNKNKGLFAKGKSVTKDANNVELGKKTAQKIFKKLGIEKHGRAQHDMFDSLVFELSQIKAVSRPTKSVVVAQPKPLAAPAPQKSEDDQLNIGRTNIPKFFSRTKAHNALLRAAAREGKEVLMPEAQGEIGRWVNGVKFYKSDSLGDGTAAKLLRLKDGSDDRSSATDEHQKNGNLLTFMAPCVLYFNNDGTKRKLALPVSFYNFTYPKFNLKNGDVFFGAGQLSPWVEKNLNEMIKINMKAVNGHGTMQNKKVPFILNNPGAFLSGLDDFKKTKVINAITDAFVRQVQECDFSNIDQFIVSGGVEFWGPENAQKIRNACANKRNPVVIGKYDFVSIVEAYKEEQGINCPVPLMGGLFTIGGGAFGDQAESAAEEFFTRASGATLYHVVNGAIQKRVKFEQNFGVGAVRDRSGGFSRMGGVGGDEEKIPDLAMFDRGGRGYDDRGFGGGGRDVSDFGQLTSQHKVVHGVVQAVPVCYIYHNQVKHPIRAEELVQYYAGEKTYGAFCGLLNDGKRVDLKSANQDVINNAYPFLDKILNKEAHNFIQIAFPANQPSKQQADVTHPFIGDVRAFQGVLNGDLARQNKIHQNLTKSVEAMVNHFKTLRVKSGEYNHNYARISRMIESLGIFQHSQKENLVESIYGGVKRYNPPAETINIWDKAATEARVVTYSSYVSQKLPRAGGAGARNGQPDNEQSFDWGGNRPSSSAHNPELKRIVQKSFTMYCAKPGGMLAIKFPDPNERDDFIKQFGSNLDLKDHPESKGVVIVFPPKDGKGGSVTSATGRLRVRFVDQKLRGEFVQFLGLSQGSREGDHICPQDLENQLKGSSIYFYDDNKPNSLGPKSDGRNITTTVNRVERVVDQCFRVGGAGGEKGGRG